MAGFANSNNPFQTQVRLGTQYIQLVQGPPGPAGQGGDLTAPNATISANYVLLATDAFSLFTGPGGYSIDCHNLVAGRVMRLLHRGTAISTSSTVTLTQGGASFQFENPYNASLATATTAVLNLPYQTYTLCLDSTNNIVRFF